MTSWEAMNSLALIMVSSPHGCGDYSVTTLLKPKMTCESTDASEKAGKE